jgi:hypothetical protein
MVRVAGEEYPSSGWWPGPIRRGCRCPRPATMRRRRSPGTGVRGRGRPFFYFAYGAAVTEVVIDTLTGENRILRADLLHDTGTSLNPALDIGQVEGAYVQGAGWLTTEELVWDGKGRLATHAPSTYKIPACSDRPPVFNVALWGRRTARIRSASRRRWASRRSCWGSRRCMRCRMRWRPAAMAGLSGAGCAGDGRAGADGGAEGARPMFDRKAVGHAWLGALRSAAWSGGARGDGGDRRVLPARGGGSDAGLGRRAVGTIGGGALEFRRRPGRGRC